METQTRRNENQQQQDRDALRDVLKEAGEYVGFGYIITRVDTGVNQTRADLRHLVEVGSIVKIPGTRGRGGIKSTWKWVGRRVASKDTHPNRCMKWFASEVQQLIDEVRDGMTIAEMANIHGRTEKAIENRLYRLSKEGRIEWGTRTGTPRQAATPTTDFEKGDETTPSLGSMFDRVFAPKPPMSFGAQAARHEALHTCVGAFLNGKVTLEGLRNAYNAVTVSKGDA
jgi:hypothetical protein